MTAIVMRVVSAEKHPNADALMVYQFSGENKKQLQIVANLTNIYSEGDHVIVAELGSILNDGTELKETKLRGVPSYGMALGKTELPIGTDVTSEYCIEQLSNEPKLVSWPSIESLFNIRKYLVDTNTLRKIKYLSKVKIHGTNAAVQILPDGQVIAQSRECVITPEKDNCGFAAWVKKNHEYFYNFRDGATRTTIFGELCGKSINKGCAIHQLDRKIFCVFAIQHDDDGVSTLEIHPKRLRDYLEFPELGVRENDIFPHNEMYVIPWFNSEPIELNFTDKEDLQKQVDIINECVLCVENRDPFVKDFFGIEGIGEGLVFYPLPNNQQEGLIEKDSIVVNRLFLNDLIFKAKGEKHAVIKTKAAAQIDPEVAKSIDDFVLLFVTEARLNQIAQKIGSFDIKLTGQFMKEFSGDVIKESTAELEASKMQWKDVGKAVSTVAQKWWISKCKAV